MTGPRFDRRLLCRVARKSGNFCSTVINSLIYLPIMCLRAFLISEIVQPAQNNKPDKQSFEGPGGLRLITGFGNRPRKNG